jgi:hypothetical protein
MATITHQNIRPRGILVVAIAMILFGLAEVATGFTHQFFGLSTTKNDASTILGAGIGMLYLLSGLFILPMKKWGAALAILCLAGDVGGRVAMVLTGYYPLGSSEQTFAMILGTLIAFGFAIYIGLRWRAFHA